MQSFLDFLSLRLFVTRSVVSVVWYVYLAATVLQLGQYLILLFSVRDTYSSSGVSPHYFVSMLPPILFGLAQLVLVRIFLEMAMQFIEKRTVQP